MKSASAPSLPEETLFSCPDCGRDNFTRAGLLHHVCKPDANQALTIVKGAAPAVIPSDYAQIGAQLTEQFNLANQGMRAVVRFGCMMLQIRFETETGSHADQFHGGRGNKGGLREWLRTYAPKVPWGSAQRYMNITAVVLEGLKLPASIKKDPAKIVEFVHSAPETLPDKLRAKQLELWEEVDGTSQRSWMDKFKPKYLAGGDRTPRDENGKRIKTHVPVDRQAQAAFKGLQLALVKANAPAKKELIPHLPKVTGTPDTVASITMLISQVEILLGNLKDALEVAKR